VRWVNLTGRFWFDLVNVVIKNRVSQILEHFRKRSQNSEKRILLISNFRRVLNMLCFLLGSFPASEIHMPTFRNTLSVPSS
jgi:gamma-glutamylcysteine synthetase